MNKQDILEHEAETLEMKKRFNEKIEIMKNLSPGDTVYIEGGHGGFDMEYFPQVIINIDLESGELEVFEESIKKSQTLESFYILENKKFILIL